MWSPELLLRTIHVIANLFWIGSIVSVGLLLGQAGANVRERGQLALAVYRRLAVPAFSISFLAGLLRMLLNLEYYFVATHFMHAKLPLALAAIAIHHILGARARRAAEGEDSAVHGASRWAVIFSILAVGAAFLALTKPFP